VFDHGDIEVYLRALDEQLGLRGRSVELVVCGGTALNVLGIVDRATRDIDVMGMIVGAGDIEEAVFEDWFLESAARVAADFDLPEGWINSEPTSMVRTGLPDGLAVRLVTTRYGDHLTVHYTSRYDLIHLKLYAAVDKQDRHLEDLKALEPSREEMTAAALWCLDQDPSDAFSSELVGLLEWMGYGEVAADISQKRSG